jgi:hypothetical protein
MTEPKTPTPDGPPDITPIRRLIRKTLHLLRSSWVATGTGLTIGLGLGTLVALALLDLATPLWSSFRLVALIAIVVPTVWAFAVGIVRPLFRRLRPVQVARKIETHIPGIHNRLVSCIDLDTSDKKERFSPEFHRRLVSEALDRIKGFHPRTVVDLRSLRRAGLFAGLSVLAFALALGLFSDRLPTALARIFSPLADIPPASGVVYTVEPGDAKALRGDDITFTVRVTKGDPEKLQLELTPDVAAKSKLLRYDLLKDEPGTWKFTLSGFEKSFNYRVRGGGTWTRKNRITMVDRPNLIGLHTVLHYPEYMGMPEPRVGPPQTADVTGPEGSLVEVVASVDGDVSEGEIQLFKSRSKQIEVLDRPERIWFQERLPLGAAAGGRWDWDLKLLARPAHTEPPAAGMHGHQFSNAAVPFPVRKGENLFAMVYINPDQKPEGIMLHWHDGASWEHRAYWGEDKFPQGKPDSPSKRKMGPLPPAGQWVRLEVPAAQVDLEDKTIRGMDFTLFGGQCFWHRAGTVPPSHVAGQELVVATTFPMQSSGQGRWAGQFPLERDTLYRVELRNELKYANKPMKPGKATAIPDNPPQVVVERPGTDIVLSEPAKVPLAIASYDDFGLADVLVSVQKGDSGGFVGRPVKKFERPTRNESFTTALDLKAMDLKAGDLIRYRVEARDRKGQTAQTREYVIRIAADNNAADKALANFEKGQDTFRENLVKLIAEQAKVQETVKAMEAKYEALEKKIETARAEAEARPAPKGDAKVPDPAKAEKPAPPKLDPEAMKQLEELRRELAQAAAKEEQNAQLGQQVEQGLQQAVEQAKNLAMLPPEMLRQLQNVPRMFEERALDPIRDLAGEMKQGAAPDQPAPDLAQIEHQAERIQKELEAVKAQLEAAAEARKDLMNDPGQALAELRAEMLRQNAGLTARDLEDLKNFLKEHAEELKRLEGQQEQLAEATPNAPEVLMPDIEKRQDALEKQEDRALDQARELLNSEQLRRMRRKDPEFPAAPYVPEAGEERVPPKEEDPDEPAAAKKKDDAAKKEDAAVKKKDEAAPEEEELFMPALGGPQPKLDPRFADKLRPLPPRDADAKGDHADEARQERNELLSRQRQRLGELETARQSLASDERALDRMLQALRNALNAGTPEAAQRMLDQLMQDPTMRAAMEMAARQQQMTAHAQSKAVSKNQNRANRPGQGGMIHNQRPTTANVGSLDDTELAKLDIETRTIILKMQPRIREELLQGLREEGPEGYKGYIRDYFRRLTQVKGTP